MNTYESEKTISLWDENDRKCVTLKNLQTGEKFTFVVKHSFVVGRVKAYCDLQITTSDRYMSGKHLRFVKEGNTISAEDMHTKNGTKINGKPVLKRTKLKQGDILRMGRSEFSVTFD